MKKEMFWQVKQAKSNKKWIALSALIVFTSLVASLIGYEFIRQRVPHLIDLIFSNVFTGQNLTTIINILARNISATLIMMLLGVLILPLVFILALNGFLIGIVIRYTHEQGLPWWKIILGLTPHAIFEIPALMIAASWGFRLGETLIKPGEKKRKNALIRVFKQAASSYVLVVLPLLAIASVIEVLVSAKIVS